MAATGKSSMGTAVVTGASSGIGKVYADRLAKRGYDLVLVARRADRLQAVQKELTDRYGVAVKHIVADLEKAADVESVSTAIANDPAITMLVNNAGTSAMGTLADATPAKLETLIQLNIVALTRLSMAVLPGFKERNRGVIVNIGSVVGFDGYPYTAIYGATKAYVLNFTRSLQQELAATNVIAQLVAPAATVSEIWDVMGYSLSNLDPAIVMTAEDCVDAALKGLDMGEKISAPSVQDADLVSRFEQASSALLIASQIGKPAPRYAIHS